MCFVTVIAVSMWWLGYRFLEVYACQMIVLGQRKL